MEHLVLAQAAHDAGAWEEAAAGYRRFVEKGGSAPDVAVAWGDVLTEAGRLAEAQAVYGAAPPADAAAAFRLGGVAHRLGRFALSRSATRRGAANAHEDGQGPVGWETPLPDVLDPSSQTVLKESGWPSRAWEPQHRGDPLGDAEPAGRLCVLSADPLPQGRPLRLVASAEMDVGEASMADALRLGEDLQAIDPNSGLLVLFAKERSSSRQALQAARRFLQARGLSAVLVELGPGTTSRAAHNLALRLAAAERADALVLRAAALRPGPDFRQVFEGDPLVGFATWREGGGFGGGRPAWRRRPAHVGHAILIRDRVLQEAGLLDALYEELEPALLDLMLRANRLGFTTVSGSSESASVRREASDPVDERIFSLRYPEHRQALEQAKRGPSAEVDRLLQGLADRRALALDMTSLRAWHDGTSALGVALALALADDPRFDLQVICTPEAARHHALDQHRGIRITPSSSKFIAAACLKIGQPFAWSQLLQTWRAAPVAGFYFLDAISLDVERLAAPVDLAHIWRIALEHSELVGHLSRYTKDQMQARFGDAAARGFVCLCSTAADEYESEDGAGAGEDPVLLVGNAYEHKNLLGAIRAIHDVSPDRDLTVLGRVLQPRPHVRWLDSGPLAHAELQRLYAGAAAIVFPSLYEGFGLPIMHALARRRPVLAVDQPVFREIKAQTRWGDAIHLFPTTRDLAASIDDVCGRGFPQAPAPVREHRWSDAARKMGDAICDALDAVDVRSLARRADAMQLVAAAEGDQAA